MKARITWVGKNQMQRDSILSAGRYTTVVRFSNETEADWKNETWSLDLTEILPETDDVVIASVQFLSPNAPQSRLQLGSIFELFEGKRCTAKGIIVS